MNLCSTEDTDSTSPLPNQYGKWTTGFYIRLESCQFLCLFPIPDALILHLSFEFLQVNRFSMQMIHEGNSEAACGIVKLDLTLNTTVGSSQ